MNPLKNAIPAKYRQVVYAVVALASAVVAIPDLVPGPLAAKITAAIASLSSLLAAGNVSPEKPAT